MSSQRRSSSPSRSTGRSSQAPKGQGMVETAASIGIEIPVFCYEPRLGAARRRLPHVPLRGRGAAEAPGRLHADRLGRARPQDGAHEREGGRGPGRDPRVHPPQPPARLPGLRQGRRVPAAGPDLPLRAGLDPHALPQADVRQADPDLAADRPRPRALHPLLPLHALLGERLGGRPARRRQPRGLVRDRHLRGRAVPRALLRQRRRALPRRGADVHDLPLPRAPVGDPERAHRLRPLPRRLQRLGDDARREGRPHPLAQPPRGGRGLALRQGPLRLRPPAGARPHPHAAPARPPPRLRGDERRGGARRRRGRAPRGRLLGRRRLLRAARPSSRRPRSPASSARGSGATRRSCPIAGTRGWPRSARRSRPSATRRSVLVLGDDPVVERAPIVDLWLRAARRAGGRVITVNPAGDVQAAPGSARAGLRGPPRGRRRDAGAARRPPRRVRGRQANRDRSGPRTTPQAAATSVRSRATCTRTRRPRSPSTSSRARRTGAASPPPGTRSARARSRPPTARSAR